jgi:hypothetical protein
METCMVLGQSVAMVTCAQPRNGANVGNPIVRQDDQSPIKEAKEIKVGLTAPLFA